jgi:hypothetical protein
VVIEPVALRLALRRLRCLGFDAYANETALMRLRVQSNVAEQLELKLNGPWRDGTIRLVRTPGEFVQRMAALVQQLYRHLPTTPSRLSFSAVRCPDWHRSSTSNLPNSPVGTCHPDRYCRSADDCLRRSRPDPAFGQRLPATSPAIRRLASKVNLGRSEPSARRAGNGPRGRSHSQTQ